jgi:hypothetical protein
LIVLWAIIPALSILAFRKWSEKLVGACAIVAYALSAVIFLMGWKNSSMERVDRF